MNRTLKHKGLIVITLCVAVIVLITQTNLLQSDSAMFNKFHVGTNAYGSWYARLSSLTENFRISLENPMFGVGRYRLYNTVLAEQG